jgi:hypothetical protein
VAGAARINPSYTLYRRKLHYAPLPADRYAGYFAELRSVGRRHDQIRSVLLACSRVGIRADVPLPACVRQELMTRVNTCTLHLKHATRAVSAIKRQSSTCRERVKAAAASCGPTHFLLVPNSLRRTPTGDAHRAEAPLTRCMQRR